jgi:hypothetical protein
VSFSFECVCGRKVVARYGQERVNQCRNCRIRRQNHLQARRAIPVRGYDRLVRLWLLFRYVHRELCGPDCNIPSALGLL